MLYIINSIFAFMFGAIFGSFFNVCIYRMPLEKSIIFPGSHCPQCNKPIRWFDNIPLLSWLVLKGKCRDCSAKISFRYVLVELITAILFLWAWLSYGVSVQAFVAVFLFSCLFISTMVDFEHQIIPDEISLGGLGVALILSAIFPQIHSQNIWWHSLLLSVLGGLVGGGMIYVTGMIGDFVFKKESMGGGDVKLMAMIGALIGWKSVVFVFFLAPFLALPMGLFLKFVKKEETLPYGPFLSLAAWIAFLWGNVIIQWYFNGLRF